jgi:bla regulator protein BlaR1
MISHLLIQLLRASLLGGALLLAVWLALRLMPRLSPAVRCWLWRLASLKLLLLLVVGGSVTIPLLPAGGAGAPAARLPEVSEGVEAGGAGAVVKPPKGDDDPARWPIYLLGLWALGVGLGGVGLWRAFLRARQLRLAAEKNPVTDPRARATLAALATRMRVRLPRLTRSERVGSPLVVGLRRPAIVVPGAALGSRNLEPLLAHELAHIRRRDLLWSWVALLGRWLLFFHPLAWIAECELRREQERAADAEALEATGLSPASYAGALLATVARRPLPLTSAAAASGFADLRARIQRLAHRPPRWARPVGALLVASTLLALPPWRLTRAAPAALGVDAGKARARFARAGFGGCFLLQDTRSGEVVSVGGERCVEAQPPCSTFKLPHAMIALDAGVLAGPDVRFRWDGRRKAFKAWQRDHTLKSAFRHSVVWYFQRVARGVGAKRMKRYLDRLGYGNRAVGSRLTRFWIDGTLRITPRQQLELLNRLYHDKLPLSRRAQRIGRELVAGAGGGKTGTCMAGGKLTTGWYVGHRSHAGRDYVFVTLIHAKDGAWGREARELSHAILRDAGLM